MARSEQFLNEGAKSSAVQLPPAAAAAVVQDALKNLTHHLKWNSKSTSRQVTIPADIQ
jgi:hypothetical protein